MSKKARTVYGGGLSKKVTDVKPRRNYWGNLYNEDTFDENENVMAPDNYDYSDYDPEDDHDSYYDRLD